MPESEESQSAFPPTRWSLVLQARNAEGSAALAEFCRLYWKPLYALARRQGLSSEDAEDITQDFFRCVIEDAERLLGKIDREHWRLRTFLVTAMRRRIIDWRRHHTREKRGGGQTAIPFAQLEPFLTATRGNRTPEQEFDRHWAATVLELAGARLQRDYAASGREKHYAALFPFLGATTGPETDGDHGRSAEKASYSAVENALGMSPAAARQAVHRFRERFRMMLRSEIADTLQRPTGETVDAEIRHLQASLRE